MPLDLKPSRNKTWFDELLSPFDPRVHKPRDIGLGGPSTEYLVTDHTPDGLTFNYPSVWWDQSGNPHYLEGDRAYEQALGYEKMVGNKFPRFLDVDTAVEAAKRRSRGGGASHIPLMQWDPYPFP